MEHYPEERRKRVEKNQPLPGTRQHRILDLALTILYPRRCPICDGVVRFGSKICPKCRKTVLFTGKDTCLKCGKPLRDGMEAVCSDCRRMRHVFDRGFALFRYRSVSGSIYRFKYLDRQEYADYYAEEMERVLGDQIRQLHADALVPVPMYEAKKRKRGYNQAEVLARAMGRTFDIPVRCDLIRRVRNTSPMKELDLSQRRSNLKGAFLAMQNDVKLKTIIVVDDIYTTGSTIDAVAGELRRIGAEHVCFVTLAIGES